jgi:hypothetical protein
MLLLHAMLLIRAFVGCILLLSGVGKLLDPAGTRRAVGDYGVPLPWRAKVARLLPALELALGAGLVFQLVPVLFSSLALILFLLFLIGMGRVLARGTAVDCHCFGALTREPVSTVTLVRLILFILLAGAVVATDVSMVAAHGPLAMARGLDSPALLIPIATTASMGAAGLLTLRQLMIVVRTGRRAPPR